METNCEENMLSRVIRSMEGVIMADGKVDLEETGILLRLIKPLAEEYGSDFRAFEQAIRAIRADGVVTDEESRRLRALIAAMADRADTHKVIKCPECARPLSVRAAQVGEMTCPWCGRAIAF